MALLLLPHLLQIWNLEAPGMEEIQTDREWRRNQTFYRCFLPQEAAQ